MSNAYLKNKAGILIRENLLEVRDLPIQTLADLYKIPEDFLLVKSKFTGICGSDFHKARLDAFRKQTVLGHECVVEYEESSFAINPLIPCNKCKYCLERHDNQCIHMKSIGAEYPGGFSEFFYMPRRNMIEIPRNDSAFILLDPFCSVYHGLMLYKKETEQNGGDEATIIGDGTIGILSAFLLDKLFKFHKIRLIGKHGWRSGLILKAFNAEIVFVPFSDYLKDESRDTSELVIEAVGGSHSESLALATSIAKTSGTIVVYGVFDPNLDGQIPLRELFRKEVKCIGSRSYTSQEFREGANLFRSLRDNLGCITDRLKLIDIDLACRLLNSTLHVEWKDSFLKLMIGFGEKNV